MNKNSEVVKKKKKIEYKKQGKKQLVEKANAVPVLEMKKKKIEKNTNYQTRQLSKKRNECIRTFHPQTYADIELGRCLSLAKKKEAI